MTQEQIIATLPLLASLLAVMVIFVGMSLLMLRFISFAQTIVLSFNRTQTAPPVPAAAPPHAPAASASPPAIPPNILDMLAKLKPAVPAAPAAHPTPVAPIATGPYAGAPPWFTLALKDIGFHEVGDNRGIEKFAIGAKIPVEQALGQPWCATALNSWLEEAGVTGTRSMSSQSFAERPDLFIQLDKPKLGCIVVFWRGSKTSGLGHVGLYASETATSINTLGGNESDGVRIEALPKDSATFGLRGYYWPKSVALPQGGAITAPASSLTHVVSAAPAGSPSPGGALTGRVSVFGGPSDTGMAPDEGLALCEPSEMGKFDGYFLPTQPPGTTGLGRRLNPDSHYIACRWDYKATPRAFLQGITVPVSANGKTIAARPIDWGPNEKTGRIADLSPGLASALGLKTDDTCTIVIPSVATTAHLVPQVT